MQRCYSRNAALRRLRGPGVIKGANCGSLAMPVIPPEWRGMRTDRSVHLSWSATLSIPALMQASSFSPPGAPDAPAAPMVSSPTLIGSAP